MGKLVLKYTHKLLCGDCTNKEDVERLMGGDRSVFCFTSPPYSNQRDYDGNLELDTKHLAKFLNIPCDLFAVNLGIQRKDNEIVQYWNDYINAAKEYGLTFLSWNIWNRSGFGYTVAQATAMFCIEHEWILIFGKRKELNKTVENKQSGIEKKGTIRQKNGDTTPVFTSTNSHRQLGTVITKDIARYVGEDHDHPAMFPVDLVVDYLLACSNENDIIYEPFCGYGTTLIACEKNQSNSIFM
jgi:DNA modification methylase